MISVWCSNFEQLERYLVVYKLFSYDWRRVKFILMGIDEIL